MQRIRVVGGPWPERIGCEGVIVSQLHDEYPWHGLGKNEVIVLLDDDPLCDLARRLRNLDYSCAIGRKDVEMIDATRR